MLGITENNGAVAIAVSYVNLLLLKLFHIKLIFPVIQQEKNVLATNKRARCTVNVNRMKNVNLNVTWDFQYYFILLG